MSKYYCLIAGLPELTLEDSKLNYTVADFKTELYPDLSLSDKKIIDLFYLKFDNGNVLRLLKDKDATIDDRGNYSSQQLLELISSVKVEDDVDPEVFPSYLVSFISDYFSEANGEPALQEDHLSALYYEYAMRNGNEFITRWFEFNLTVNNILVALIARKYKQDVAQSIVGQTEISEALRTSSARDFGLTNELDYFDQLVKISEIADLVEREKKLDALKWSWMENAVFFHYFTIERIFVFLIRLEMVERWISMDKEKGNQLFRSIIDSLKNDVQIPAEFR
ncbi:DUF2764 family protein [uncultured Bacteroides sp.]|uniref:DUF2764 family protein n=1 Tax=uncultured Bacteroides sp. TaxID=162156 RepID=UPI002AA8D11D|nr:DUF2764 family protein [uncultured Bacteroides sp.]